MVLSSLWYWFLSCCCFFLPPLSVCVKVHMLRSEDNLGESCGSFHHVDPEYQTQNGLGGEYLYHSTIWSALISLCFHWCFFQSTANKCEGKFHRETLCCFILSFVYSFNKYISFLGANSSTSRHEKCNTYEIFPFKIGVHSRKSEWPVMIEPPELLWENRILW